MQQFLSAISPTNKRSRIMFGGYYDDGQYDDEEETTSTSEGKSPQSAASDSSGSKWAVFAPKVTIRDLPIVVFNDDATEQQVWYSGSVASGRVRVPRTKPDVVAENPVVMSPAYLGFAIEPYEQRYLHFRKVGIIFARPRGGTFMQPSIDTILVCLALAKFFDSSSDLSIKKIVDIGSGSGFIAKFAATYAPGEGPLGVSLVDIDQRAMDYCRSLHFNAGDQNPAGRPLVWEYHAGDAVEFLKTRSGHDLLISNPPYIPTVVETRDASEQSLDGNFWEGCGLVAFLLEMMLKAPSGTHLVLAFSSMTLKSLRVRELFNQAPSRNLAVKVLLEREVAWKAWYAGRGSGARHLLASGAEESARQRIGDCEFFVGATEPGSARFGGGGGRKHRFWDYHWHMSYVVHVTQMTSPTGAAPREQRSL